MKIKLEILKSVVADIVCQNIGDVIELDENEIVNTISVKAIGEIQEVLKSDIDDFEMIEEIVLIFEKYGIDAGNCHDFG